MTLDDVKCILVVGFLGNGKDLARSDVYGTALDLVYMVGAIWSVCMDWILVLLAVDN